MHQNIQTLFIGCFGIATSEAVEVAHQLDPKTVTSTIGLVTQLVILVATLFGILKKKKQ